MQLPDVNVLIYAHREDAPEHEKYAEWLSSLAEGAAPFALSSVTLSDFYGSLPIPRIFQPATPMPLAASFLSSAGGEAKRRVCSAGRSSLGDHGRSHRAFGGAWRDGQRCLSGRVDDRARLPARHDRQRLRTLPDSPLAASARFIDHPHAEATRYPRPASLTCCLKGLVFFFSRSIRDATSLFDKKPATLGRPPALSTLRANGGSRATSKRATSRLLFSRSRSSHPPECLQRPRCCPLRLPRA